MPKIDPGVPLVILARIGMPIEIEETQILATSVLDALSPATLDLGGLQRGERERVRRQLALIEACVQERSAQRLSEVLHALIDNFRNAAPAALVALAARIDAMATIDPSLREHAGAAFARAGLCLWKNRRDDDALRCFEQAADRLETLDGDRAIREWVTVRCSLVRLQARRAIDDSMRWCDTLLTRCERDPRCALDAQILFAIGRLMTAMNDAGHHEACVSIAQRVDALPARHLERPQTWQELMLVVHARCVFALRKLNLDEQALERCRRALDPLVTELSEDARIEIAWLYTEAAYLCADKLRRPELALTFVEGLRAFASSDDERPLLGELAYAAVVHARALLLLGRASEAIVAADEGLRYVDRYEPREHVASAWAGALAAKGQALAARGERDRARAALNECIERFGAAGDPDLEDELDRARAALSSLG
jgi:tetratricopeptide (TPR) repeat protein